MSLKAQAAKTHSRKQYLINPGFQWKHAGAIAMVVFLVSVLMSIVLYATLHQQARLRSMNPTSYSADVTSVMVCFALGFAALTSGGVGLWSILMTHRICGPVYVMKRYLNDLTEGRLPSLRPLRRKDEFKDLHEAFDKAIATLRARKQRELMQLDAVLECIEQAQAQQGASAPSTLAKAAERIAWLRQRAQEALTDDPRAAGRGEENPAGERCAAVGALS